jgi:serine/threonine protein kinase
MSPPAVPALRDVIHDAETGQVHLVFDYAGPPILDAVDPGVTPEAAARNGALAADATLSLLTALYELHGAGYCYTDMKPQQMLWDASREAEEFRAKLADFGAGEGAGVWAHYWPSIAGAIPECRVAGRGFGS